MPIDPDIVYGLFRFNAKNGPNWSIERNMSADFVAGLLVAIHAIYAKMNNPTVYNYNVRIFPVNNNYVNVNRYDNPDEYDLDDDYYYEFYGNYYGDTDADDKILNIVDVVDGYGNMTDLYGYYSAVNYYFWNLLNDNNTWEELDYQQDEIQYQHVYYWYIYDNDGHGNQTYKLYTFNIAEFIQGFITICRAFQVDFRYYIQGNPFRYDTGNNTQTFYSIEV